jgi:membrane associated rhomboid family serine protease
MSWFPKSQDRLPLTWWKGHPIFLAAVVALVGAASMVLTALLLAINRGWVEALVFSFQNAYEKGFAWSIVTYVLVNPPSIWFLLSTFLLWKFGQQVEEHLGRRAFVRLLLALLFVTPLLLSLVGLIGSRLMPAAGLGMLEFGVFIAFATLYPGARISLILFSIEAWVFAMIVVAVSALGLLAARDWPGMIVLAGQVLVAYGYTRYEQGIWVLPRIRIQKSAKKAKPAAGSAPRPAKDAPAPQRTASSPAAEGMDPVDRILDKIHRDGIGSLSAEERRIIEEASKNLRREGS